MHRFGKEWHDLIESGDSPFDDIEKTIDVLEATRAGLPRLPDYGVLPFSPLWGESDRKRRLGWTACNLDVTRRKTLVRSLHLLRGLIVDYNGENYPAIPLVLRALLEEGSYSISAAERLKGAFLAYRDTEKWEPFANEQELTLYGSRADQVSLWESVLTQHPNKPTSAQELAKLYESEIGSALALGEEGAYSVSEKGSSNYPWYSRNILSVVDAAGKVLFREGRFKHPTWLGTIYSWLSEASHPTSNSWRLNRREVFDGGVSVASPAEEYEDRVAAAALYGKVAQEFVIELTHDGFNRLTSLLQEVSSDFDMFKEVG